MSVGLSVLRISSCVASPILLGKEGAVPTEQGRKHKHSFYGYNTGHPHSSWLGGQESGEQSRIWGNLCAGSCHTPTPLQFWARKPRPGHQGFRVPSWPPLYPTDPPLIWRPAENGTKPPISVMTPINYLLAFSLGMCFTWTSEYILE